MPLRMELKSKSSSSFCFNSTTKTGLAHVFYHWVGHFYIWGAMREQRRASTLSSLSMLAAPIKIACSDVFLTDVGLTDHLVELLYIWGAIRKRGRAWGLGGTVLDYTPNICPLFVIVMMMLVMMTVMVMMTTIIVILLINQMIIFPMKKKNMIYESITTRAPPSHFSRLSDHLTISPSLTSCHLSLSHRQMQIQIQVKVQIQIQKHYLAKSYINTTWLQG